MDVILTSNSPLPLGHYSQGIKKNDTIYVSGQLPIDPQDTSRQITDIKEQTLQTLKNLVAVVEAGGGDKTTIAKVTLFITDLAQWPEINEAYGAFFGAHKPTRSAVPVTGLPKGYGIEIEAIAYTRD